MEETLVLKSKKIIGWHEWLSLPDLNIPYIKAKIDTGATTSSIGVSEIRHFTHKGAPWVKFNMMPFSKIKHSAIAEIVDERIVSDSGGHRQLRYVIKTLLKISEDNSWEIELTLANRTTMRYQMLLGREAMAGKIMVDPGEEYLLGKHSIKDIRKLYNL
ncbi:MAG: ATP-dependent zinc protease [Sphingobacteriia bacterium]|nr:ATP-dependent zinc protease [Sphingobacteriia bacterium]